MQQAAAGRAPRVVSKKFFSGEGKDAITCSSTYRYIYNIFIEYLYIIKYSATHPRGH